MLSKEEIQRRLWNGANELRGSMDASRYKDYMLGLMFYKFLSDKTLGAYVSVSKSKASGDALVKDYADGVKKYGPANGTNRLIVMLKKYLDYYVLPHQLYQSWVISINSGNFEVEKVISSLNDFEKSVAGSGSSVDFTGLFSGLDLTDTALGANLKQRSDNIKALIMLFADLNMVALQENDILGDAYEYLIGMFALESGKKAGEFYTPHYVSEIIARIAVKSADIKTIYDPAVGSGSLLLTVKGHLNEDQKRALRYYGQEKNTATYNLTRMNLLLHGVNPANMDIRNGDTLAEDWPEDTTRPGQGITFDAIVMNPPYSAKNWNKAGLKGTDPRFEYIGGILPPDNKGDYAFLLHGLFHLDTNGTMGIVLPHGVLFRGAAEGAIRKRLIDKELIDAVIGLPAGMFTNTGIPVIVMILKKNRKLRTPILIIDASQGYSKQGKQNVLRERDIAKVVDTYMARKEIPCFCHLATKAEIVSNDYNLNIPRYVESAQEESGGDVAAHLLGGIPEADITSLSVLNDLVPLLIGKNFKPLRKGYLKMETTAEDFSEQVKTSSQVNAKIEELREKITAYGKTYYKRIKEFMPGTPIAATAVMKEEMLGKVMKLLAPYSFIDAYEGYQIVADLWREQLAHDIGIIAEKGFYEAGRTVVPNMVVKGNGSARREEQDGVRGAIVPNELIEKRLFAKEAEEIAGLQEEIESIESRLAEHEENATDESIEHSEGYAKIYDEDSEKIDRKKVKDAIKEGTDTAFFEEIENLYSDKADFSRRLKALQTALKEEVQDKIPDLTNKEIDSLMNEKWFAPLELSAASLVMKPVEAELAKVKSLYDDYGTTLDDIENEIAALDKEIAAFTKELAVTE
jgi:type I restriction enzyme M protein